MDEDAIFTAASEKADPAEQEAFLAEACGDDTDLRRRVETLLRAHDRIGGLARSMLDPADVTRDAPTPADSTVDRSVSEGPGTVIGPYKLLQQIGAGGMGVVFMAEQEHPVRRKVALKIIKPGMDTGQVVARFEAERQALALMEHDHIARVLDAGQTASGRPYFVMELVRGVPITEYCDRHGLTPRERLELFIPVCQAIQHAHQKGIIHRDVKPSNVLVTSYDGNAVPKVIDFGVAKAIDQRLTEKTLFTQFGAIVGTLEYMSPEQAEIGALDIDTRSDIYSLGVLLYEMLTGSTPLQKASLRGVAYSEALRRIREEEPPKPSTRLDTTEELPSIAARRKTEPAKLSRLVRGDLDWIVMKALEKDRTRRYETANALARDIQRHLEGDPVEAGPPSAGYKLRKFARKHRVALTTAGGFALLLATAALVSSWLAYRATRAERLARSHQLRAEERLTLAINAVKRYADTLAGTPKLKRDPSLGSLRTELLKEPLAFFKALREQLQSDRDTSPEALSRLASAASDLAGLTNEIGDQRDALRMYEESLTIYERLVRENPGIVAFRCELGVRHHDIGVLRTEAGESGEALASFAKAREIQERLVRENPGAAEFQDNLGQTYNNIGILQRDTGRLREALDSYDRAREIFEELTSASPGVVEFQSGLALSHHNIGLLHRQTGRPDDALSAHEKALAIRARLSRRDPDNIEFLSDVAISLGNIGALRMESGRPDDALRSMKGACEIQERLVRENPAVTAFQSDLASGHNNIGNLHRDGGRPAEAQTSFTKALKLRERLARDNPEVVEFQSHLATSHTNIGIAQDEAGRRDEALSSYNEARKIQERLTRDHPNDVESKGDLATSHYSIGNLHLDAGRVDEALTSYGRARKILERLTREQPTVTAYQNALAATLHNLATIEASQGRLDEAGTMLQRAIVHQRTALRSEPRNSTFRRFHADHLRALTQIELHSRHPTEAASAAREWAAIAPERPGDLYDVARYLAQCAGLSSERSEGYADEATAVLKRAVVAGWTDWTHAAADPDLRPLHGRHVFQELVFDRIFPARPFAKPGR